MAESLVLLDKERPVPRTRRMETHSGAASGGVTASVPDARRHGNRAGDGSSITATSTNVLPSALPAFEEEDRALLGAIAADLPRRRRDGWLVTPETLLRWHRRRIARHWTQPCRRPGRPCTSVDLRRLIIEMATNNPCGARNWIGGADQGFRAPSWDQESARDSVHEDSASAPIAAGQRPRQSFRHP